MKKLLIAAFLLNSITGYSQGEYPSPANLDFMKGDWKGPGWMMIQRTKVNSVATEKVECKIDCKVYVVQGLGVKYDSASKKDVVVHDAFGTISFDKAKGKWVLRAFKKDGMTEAELNFISDKKFSWSLVLPGDEGMIRFTTDFSSGKWEEIGEFSFDKGNKWIPIMGISLEKQ